MDPLAEIYPHITPYAYCLNNPVRLVDPDGMFASEIEANTFVIDNEMIGYVDQREDGSYQVTITGNNTVYYHDENGMLNVDLPSIEVTAQRKEPEPTFFDKVADGYSSAMNSADDWTNDNLYPIVAGTALLFPPIGLTNDVYAINNDVDIYGNEVDAFNKIMAVVDITTFGFGKYLKFISRIGKTNRVIKTHQLISDPLADPYLKINSTTTWIGASSTYLNTNLNESE